MMRFCLLVCLLLVAVNAQFGTGAGGAGGGGGLLESAGGQASYPASKFGRQRSGGGMGNPLLAMFAMNNDNLWPWLFMGGNRGGGGGGGGGFGSMMPLLWMSMMN